MLTDHTHSVAIASCIELLCHCVLILPFSCNNYVTYYVYPCVDGLFISQASKFFECDKSIHSTPTPADQLEYDVASSILWFPSITMATSASKTTNLLKKLYKTYKSYLEVSIVEAQPDKVVELLQAYLSEAQKVLLSTPDKSAKAATLQKILREKLLESKENFLGILRALSQFFYTDNIIEYAEKNLHSLRKSTEQDKRKRILKKRSLTQPSITLKRTQSEPNSTSSKADEFQYGKRSKTQPTPLPLDKNPGSPSNRHISDDSRRDPELDSYSYQQPVEPSIPEHTIISQSSHHFAETEVVAPSIPSYPTSRRLSMGGQGHAPNEDVHDDIDVIDKLDEELGRTIIGVQENHDNIDMQFSVVKNSYKRLVKLYQQEIQQLKEQQLEQKARNEEEVRFNVAKIEQLKEQLAKNEQELQCKTHDLAKQVEDKETEIQGLTAKLETAKFELKELRVKNKQIVVEEIYDQLCECESLLRTPTKPVTDILVIIRQKLSMLKKRPYTA